MAGRHPILALGFTAFLLAPIGMPPTAAFVGKLYLLSAAIQRGLVGLAVISVLNANLNSAADLVDEQQKKVADASKKLAGEEKKRVRCR